MVFSSVPFLFFFLPIFLACYFLSSGNTAKNIIALLFSLVFHAWGGPQFTLLLLGAIVFNFTVAVLIEAQSGTFRKLALGFSIAVNVGLLIACKYADFMADNLAALGFSVSRPGIPLPLGISFFTFHCLSYIIDVYRGRFPANRRPTEIALYIVLFPQLVAGPIVRYSTVAKQLRARRHSFYHAVAGTRIFVIGLAQKVLIADEVAWLSDAAFDQAPNPSFHDAWSGLLAYTIQIYFDFAGYSNMAIGLGLVLGFTFPRNFRLPYTSLSVTEFWRRWHMSLSSWLRDYLYIPLGGSRGSNASTYRNLITVFLLCGLWHGASWNFLIWGAWHGTFLILERAGLGRLLNRSPGVFAWIYAMFAVMGGWVLFRSHDLQAAESFLKGLLNLNGNLSVLEPLRPATFLALLIGAALAILPRWRWKVWLPWSKMLSFRAAQTILDKAIMLGLLTLSALSVAAGTFSPFLYFRF
jgi:alginate O-acetyltransferase complex protein AlgI